MPLNVGTISFTETRQFRRLVEFVTEVEAHAVATGDEQAVELVEDLRAELREMQG